MFPLSPRKYSVAQALSLRVSLDSVLFLVPQVLEVGIYLSKFPTVSVPTTATPGQAACLAFCTITLMVTLVFPAPTPFPSSPLSSLQPE